jgi:hypothetical protein
MLLECFDIHVNDLFIDLFHGFYDRKLSQLVLSIIKIKKVLEFWCTRLFLGQKVVLTCAVHYLKIHLKIGSMVPSPLHHGHMEMLTRDVTVCSSRQ